MDEVLSGKGRSLGASLRRIRSNPDIQTIYDDLKNAEEKSLRTVIWRLQQKGLLRRDGKKIAITNTGVKAVGVGDLEKQKWDGKWRIIFFDIPTNNESKRKWLRRQLYSQGYRMLQKSVFVGKQPLSQEVFEDFHSAGLGQCIRMITVGEIDDESIFDI